MNQQQRDKQKKQGAGVQATEKQNALDDEASDRKKQIKIARGMNWIAMAAAILSFVGILLLIATFTLTKKQFMLSQRPWLSFVPEVGSNFTFVQPDVARITLKFHLRNSGLTPGAHAFIYAKFVRVNSTPKQAADQKDFACAMAKSFINDSEEVVMPGGETVEQREIVVPQDEIDYGRRNSNILFIQIASCVAYRSSAEELYTSGQIYTLSQKAAQQESPAVRMPLKIGENVLADQLIIEPKNSTVLLQ